MAPAVALGLLGEATASGFGAHAGSLWQRVGVAFWSLGLWALPGLASAALFAALAAIGVGDTSLASALRSAWGEPARRHALLIGLLGSSLLFAGVFGLSRAGAGFHDVELSAATVATLTLLLSALIGLISLWFWRRLGQATLSKNRATFLAVSVLVISCLVVGWVWNQCRAGLEQLDPRLLALPLALLAGIAGFASWDPPRVRRRVALAALSAVGLAAWLEFLASGERAAMAVAAHGTWSRLLISGLQRVSDVDRDGYSSLLGGGDCAPFDARVHPGATEVVGDGIDNNCVGGDAARAAPLRRPVWGPSAHADARKLNVVVVTIEALRQDHASFLGAARDTTPTLRALAAQSLVFERMYSAASFTRLSLASLFSSLAPSEIEWLPQAASKRMRRIGPRTPWLPELLQKSGYETIAVLSDFSAFTAQESAGFERGFTHYDISTSLEYRGGTMWGFPAAIQVDKALGYVRAAERPFLLWLHLFEPHYRYEQPPGAPVFGQDERARYDAEIWHADHELGRLLQGLREQGVWDDTLLFVSGDHGESFGEHGDRWHGTSLFEPQVRPAALLRIPGVSGRRVDAAVTFSDIAPTVARVLGDRQSFDQLRGRSLAPLIHHAKLPPGDDGFVIETFAVEDGHAHQAAFISYPLKLLYQQQSGTFTLFDLERDPGELAPIEPNTDPRSPPLMRELSLYLERTHPAATKAP